MVERPHRKIKDALRAHLARAEWPLHLPWVLLGLPSAPEVDSAVSSAELVFGTTLTLTEQFLASMEWPLAEYIKQPYTLRPWPQFRTSC
jgi:hypothetical protein